jgi:3-hydroxyisobutyrate dehydrogenase-like beta-hydroxyacid dehydrogenase
MTEARQNRTIGILYPGEMGSALGKLLCENGSPVVTTVEGRSPRTQRLCQEAGLRILPSTADVLQCSQIVISLVTPGSALRLAKALAAQPLPRGMLYVDANSISSTTALEIAEVLRQAGVDFADASIHGLASQLRQRGTIYLSGTRAAELSELFRIFMGAKVVGEAPGQASAFKMIMAGLSKGMVGLFVETMLFARELGLLDDALAGCQQYYPGVTEAIERLLPTYPQHAARRTEELRELEAAMQHNGLPPRVVRGVREIIAHVARVDWTKRVEERRWKIAEIIEEVHRQGVLRDPKSVPSKTHG